MAIVHRVYSFNLLDVRQIFSKIIKCKSGLRNGLIGHAKNICRRKNKSLSVILSDLSIEMECEYDFELNDSFIIILSTCFKKHTSLSRYDGNARYGFKPVLINGVSYSPFSGPAVLKALLQTISWMNTDIDLIMKGKPVGNIITSLNNQSINNLFSDTNFDSGILNVEDIGILLYKLKNSEEDISKIDYYAVKERLPFHMEIEHLRLQIELCISDAINMLNDAVKANRCLFIIYN